MNRLKIINAQLASIELNPVSSENSNPFVITAGNIIDDVSAEVQSTGWWFNRYTNFVLSPDADGKLVLPDDTVRVDSVSDNSKLLVQRGNYLFNTDTHSYVIGEQATVDLVMQLEINELPTVAATYIKHYAVYLFFVQYDGEQAKAKNFADLMNNALVRLSAEEIKQADQHVTNNIQYLQACSRTANYGY